MSAFLEDSTASTEAMRAGDQEALTKNLMKIGRDGACPLAGLLLACVVQWRSPPPLLTVPH